jgi:hypothetical protein
MTKPISVSILSDGATETSYINVEGEGGISATIIADSVSPNGQRITTFELVYPRFIHSEFMTHRMFSRNAASSRAIPVKKMAEQVGLNPAKPIHWGKNQPGMTAREELEFSDKLRAEELWDYARLDTLEITEQMYYKQVHKQVINRLLEPFQFIKVVCTATEYENFFYLRDHPDAQPEIQELARCMKEAREMSTPVDLKVGEWHLPYCQTNQRLDGELLYAVGDDFLKEEAAIKISASCCAQVSYRLLDASLEKALKIYDQLVESKPVHSSPFEHQATPMDDNCTIDNWSEVNEGATHLDTNGALWSGNFKGWVQHRQLIPNNVKEG